MGFMLVPFVMKFLYCQDTEIIYPESNDIEEYASWVRETIIRDKEYEDRIIGLCKIFICDNETLVI